MPVTNTIKYSEYKRKSPLEKFKFLKENSRQVLCHYQKQLDKCKKLKENEGNKAAITQYTNETLSYDMWICGKAITQCTNETLSYEMWKSNLIKPIKPKKVEPTFKQKKVEPPMKIPQIDLDNIQELDKMPQHKWVVL